MDDVKFFPRIYIYYTYWSVVVLYSSMIPSLTSTLLLFNLQLFLYNSMLVCSLHFQLSQTETRRHIIHKKTKWLLLVVVTSRKIFFLEKLFSFTPVIRFEVVCVYEYIRFTLNTSSVFQFTLDWLSLCVHGTFDLYESNSTHARIPSMNSTVLFQPPC